MVASLVLKTPRTVPSRSVTPTCIRAGTPIGWRIAARVTLAMATDCVISVVTSSAVSFTGPGIGLSMIGMRISPGTPANTAGGKLVIGVAIIFGKFGLGAPGRLANGISGRCFGGAWVVHGN